MHPEDAAAQQSLRGMPLLAQLSKAVMKFYTVRASQLSSMANKVRLGPNQLPEIYRYLPAACGALNIPEPEFYLEMNPQPNAYAEGNIEVGLITVTSGLLETMDDDEMQAVIGHECGHIACHHLIYKTITRLLLQVGPKIFGPLAAISTPVQIALLNWERKGELSADRAGAIVMGGSRSIVETMIRLAGGPKSITSKVDVSVYMEQAEAMDTMTESGWDRALQTWATLGRSHPFNSARAREITAWCESVEFEALMKAIREPTSEIACAQCGVGLKPEWKFCGGCGAPGGASKGGSP